MKSAQEQLEYLRRGAVEIINEAEALNKLERSLKTRKPLTVKVGFDPTAPDIHMGHVVLLRKMKDFQDLGHQVIFLIGDFTGLIGDPSGRSKTRPALTREEIDTNAETYKCQVFKILDSQRTVVDFNNRWLGSLRSSDWIRLASSYTVARMLERDDFAKRLKSNQPVSIHELLYPLSQAYDSVFLKADFELGGTDQKFNLLVGRDIMREYGLEPQVILTMPLLEGLDGVEKMSKSLGNYVGITEAPEDIYGKIMSISDSMMFRYLELLTELPQAEVDRLKTEVARGERHPMKVKGELAFRIVEELQGAPAARAAEEHFARVHRRGEAPEEMPEHRIERTVKDVSLVELLIRCGLAPSKTEARRLIKNGAVSVDGNKVTDPATALRRQESPLILRCGKLRFCQVRWA